MGPKLRLFTAGKCSVGAVLAVAKLANVEVTPGNTDPNCVDYRRNVHPMGVVPALETECGYIAGTSGILRYLGEKGRAELVGRTAFERAAVDSFVAFAAEVEPLADGKDSGRINGVLQGLDDWLRTRTFLVSERMSLADIAVAFAMLPLYESVLDIPSRTPYTELNRWFDTVANHPAVLPQLPKTFCSKAPGWYNASAQPPVTVSQASSAAAPAAAPPAAEGKKKKEKGEKKEKKEEPAWKKEAAAKKNAPAEVDGALFDLRVGHIVDVRKHPEADSLFVEKIDVGDEAGPREICSGLVNFMKESDILNKMVVVMCNLKPVKMRGIASNGMVMCSEKDGKVCLTKAPEGAKAGDRVVLEKYEKGAAKSQLNSKKLDALMPELRTDAQGVCHWKDAPFMVPGKGVCSSALVDAKVK